MCPLSVSLEGLSLQLKECIRMMENCLDLAQQLHGCEKHQIIHGDIKAENVLLGRNWRTGKRFAALADWGGAVRLPEGSDSVSIEVGTPCCQAPESLCCFDAISKEDIGSQASTPSDMFSFGAMLPRVLFLFTEVLSVLSPEVVDAIQRCLCLDPNMRPSAAEMCTILERCLVELRLAEEEELQTMQYVLDCVNAPLQSQPRSMHLMRHLLAFVKDRQALGANVAEPDFVQDVDSAVLWLAADAVGCADQLGDYVWSVGCGRLGVEQATVWLEGWDDLLAHEGRVMAALREQMLEEGMHADWTMQRAKDIFPDAFAEAYRQKQMAFGASLV